MLLLRTLVPAGGGGLWRKRPRKIGILRSASHGLNVDLGPPLRRFWAAIHRVPCGGGEQSLRPTGVFREFLGFWGIAAGRSGFLPGRTELFCRG